MPDILDKHGLQVKSFQELQEEIENGYKTIYGEDINIAPDTPDGQQIALLVQLGSDIRELISQTYASFDPDQAIGTVLDQRVAINNIQRIQGEFTIVPVQVVRSQAYVTLNGLDDFANDPSGGNNAFTIQDNAGNKFFLVDTNTNSSPNTTTLNFRAANVGEVQVTPNTIQTMTTIILGVTSVNNTSGASYIGKQQESDQDLRLRRQQSVSNGSVSYVDSIKAEIFAQVNVTDVAVYENVTDADDADGIPPHSIWCIAKGGSNTDIAQAIYDTKSDGSGMKGSVEVPITSQSNQTFTVKFDRPVEEELYISMQIKQIDTSAVFDTSTLKDFLIDNLSYRINQGASSAEIIGLIAPEIAGGVPINCGVSLTNSGYVDYLETSSKLNEFILATGRIDITVVA